MDSILATVRKALVGDADNDSFDTNLIIHINSAFAELSQISEGLPQDYRIEDVSDAWDTYYKGSAISMIKDYIILKTRIIFDPPMSTAVLDAFKAEADRLEWRIHVETDKKKQEVTDK